MPSDFGQREIVAPPFPLKVLLVEDNPDDAQLCLRALRKAVFDVQVDVVHTQEEFYERLGTTIYDVILSDYNLGNWTGMDALHLLQTRKRDIPFILVTGALGDQAAVECVKNGVADYVLKDHLERLPLAICRAVEEKVSRNERQRAETLLFESEAKFRMLTEAIPVGVFVEQDTQCCYVNDAAEHITGYSRKELLGMNFWQLLLPTSRKTLIERPTKDDESTSHDEAQIINKRGEKRWLDVTVGSFQIKGRLAALIATLDITDRKCRENELSYRVE